MTSLSRHFTVDTVHKDRPFTVYQLAVHTCGYGRQCARKVSRILAWTMLFINITQSMYLKVNCLNFVPSPTLHHLPQSCYSHH